MPAMMRNVKRMKQQMTGMKCAADTAKMMAKVAAQRNAATIFFKTKSVGRRRISFKLTCLIGILAGMERQIKYAGSRL